LDQQCTKQDNEHKKGIQKMNNCLCQPIRLNDEEKKTTYENKTKQNKKKKTKQRKQDKTKQNKTKTPASFEYSSFPPNIPLSLFVISVSFFLSLNNFSAQ
jgi:hypothetical protein